MFKRLPEDGGPPGKALEPSWAPRFYHPEGLLALAAGPGKVTYSQPIGTGETVTIDHGGGWQSQYMHMRNRLVKQGESVSGGQAVGTISFNPLDWHLIHLHFQIRKDGQLVDPGPIIAPLPVLSGPTGGGAFLWIAAAAAFGFGVYYLASRA
jgi:murein DD-endopeptidase MepM/ murein hydrolase activator NlpD